MATTVSRRVLGVVLCVSWLMLVIAASGGRGLTVRTGAPPPTPPPHYNALDAFSARVVANFIDGTLGGLLQEARGNYSLLELQLYSNCSVGSGISPSELLMSLEETMNNFYTVDVDLGVDALDKGLAMLSQTIVESFVPILQSCNASSNITSALVSAAQTLTNVDAVNGTIAELIINSADVYSELASSIGYWTRTDFLEAGVYFGVVLQKTSEMTNTSYRFCSPPPVSELQGSRLMWQKFYDSIAAAIPLEPNEKVVPVLNTFMPWDWCWMIDHANQSYPGTYICDPERNILGTQQYYSLNLITNYTNGDAPYNPYFDQNYQFFLSTVNISQLTTEEAILLNEAFAAFDNMSNYATYIGYEGEFNMTLWNTSIGALDYIRDFINYTQALPSPWTLSLSGDTNYVEFCSGNPGVLELGNVAQQFNQSFIQALRNGTWHDVEVDYFHSNFSLDISGNHLMRVNVSAGGWFIPETIAAFEDHLMQPGLTREQLLDSMITGIVVASGISGSAKMFSDYRSAYNDFWEPGEELTFEGVKVGSIFTQGFKAEVGYESLSSTVTFNHDSSSVMPQIAGYIIRKLPF